MLYLQGVLPPNIRSIEVVNASRGIVRLSSYSGLGSTCTVTFEYLDKMIKPFLGEILPNELDRVYFVMNKDYNMLPKFKIVTTVMEFSDEIRL